MPLKLARARDLIIFHFLELLIRKSISLLTACLTVLTQGKMSQTSQIKKSDYHRHVNEIKRDKVLKAKRLKAASNASILSKAVLEELYSWGLPEFINLRHFAEVVHNSPLNFPIEHNELAITRKENNEIRLHLKLRKKIESGNFFKRSNAC